MRTEASLDIDRLTRQRVADVTREAGDIAAIDVRVEAVGLYETDTYSGRTTASTPLRITDDIYELETPQTDRPTRRPSSRSLVEVPTGVVSSVQERVPRCAMPGLGWGASSRSSWRWLSGGPGSESVTSMPSDATTSASDTSNGSRGAPSPRRGSTPVSRSKRCSIWSTSGSIPTSEWFTIPQRRSTQSSTVI